MPVSSKLSALCAAGLFAAQFATATPILRPRDGDSFAGKLPAGINRGKCGNNLWDNKQARWDLWKDANGWELVDRYLDQNSGFAPGWTEHWPSKIFRELFNQDGTEMDCSGGDDVNCDHHKTCAEFEAVGWPGFFYILESLKNIYSYFNVYKDELETMRKKLERDIPVMVESLIGGLAQQKAKEIKMKGIMFDSLGMAAELIPNEGAATGVGAILGIAQMFDEHINGEPPNLEEDATKALRSMINFYVESMKREVNVARDAIFGNADYVPSRENYDPNRSKFSNEFIEIPNDMKIGKGVPGATDGWNHPITEVLGDGQWLSPHPSDDLSYFFQTTYLHIRQRLAVQILRQVHGAVMVINHGDDTREKCEGAGPNNQWDDAPGRNWCYGIMWVENGDLKGGINGAAFPLWESYDADAANSLVSDTGSKGFGMSKLETYRNILDCWYVNDANADGQMKPEFMQGETNLPQCMFSMEVKKGNWQGSCGPHHLVLDSGFKNFPTGVEGQTMWPGGKGVFC
ncbi:hypothetical protein P154DRAFT_566680 [Amniculicola lignicola CBS 123094]|uniref:Uncharacterized protein n=1 Tax=Amniculicola lignicola CBS 123094 TaxID=1392246 RepID=A0A6A5W1C4_9PLEO|nr:hypothetical protein P154DRAFT_566680 [Amniculicola lignicola CBS 123094]